MKSYIVRTPEHDRRLLTVPEGAGDLPKTVRGQAIKSTASVAENGAIYRSGFTTLTNSYGAQLTPDGSISVNEAGLYLVIVNVVWDWQTPGSILRQIGYSLNGVDGLLVQNSTVADAHTDQATTLVRLVPTDVLQVAYSQIGGGSATQALVATLQFAQLSP